MLSEPEIIIGLVSEGAVAHISTDLSQEFFSVFHVYGNFPQASNARFSIAFQIVRTVWFWPSVLSTVFCALQYVSVPSAPSSHEQPSLLLRFVPHK